MILQWFRWRIACIFTYLLGWTDATDEEYSAAVCRAKAEWNELERMSIEEETWAERL